MAETENDMSQLFGGYTVYFFGTSKVLSSDSKFIRGLSEA